MSEPTAQPGPDDVVLETKLPDYKPAQRIGVTGISVGVFLFFTSLIWGYVFTGIATLIASAVQVCIGIAVGVTAFIMAERMANAYYGAWRWYRSPVTHYTFTPTESARLAYDEHTGSVICDVTMSIGHKLRDVDLPLEPLELLMQNHIMVATYEGRIANGKLEIRNLRFQAAS